MIAKTIVSHTSTKQKHCFRLIGDIFGLVTLEEIKLTRSTYTTKYLGDGSLLWYQPIAPRRLES
jgi:hypothetical protein